MAVGNVQLGVLDSQRLAQEFARLTPELRGFLISLDKRLKQLNERAYEFHQNIPFDKTLLENKKSVIKQGTSEDSLYVVTEGSAYVIRHEDQGIVPLAQLTKGDYFGNVPFLDFGHEPEFASVLAPTDFKVRKIDMTPFRNEFNQMSTTFKNFVDNVASCVSVSTKVVCNLKKNVSAGK
jgi:CRP-like cAMP-binding protein